MAKCSLIASIAGLVLVGVPATKCAAQDSSLAFGSGIPLPQSDDVITGQNNPGPYLLGWNNIAVDIYHKATVVVDGVTLNTDGYTIDIFKGTITFATPLKTTSVARVEYCYDYKVAQRNAAFTSTPVTVPLMQAAGTQFQLTALPTNLTSGSNGATMLVYGVNRTTNMLGGGLSSKALFSSVGSSLDLGFKYGGAKNGFDADIQRTERSFASELGKPLNLADPSEKMNLNARMRPSNILGLGLTFGDQHDLAAGTTNAQTGMSLNFGGTASVPTINYNRTMLSVDPTMGGATMTTTDKVDMKALLGKTTSVTANGQRVATDAPGTQSDTTAQNATVALTTATTNKQQQATVSITSTVNDNVTNIETDSGLQVKLQPAPLVTLSANQTEQHIAPVATVSTPAAPATTTNVTAFAAQIGTGKAIEVTGGMTNRAATAPGVVALDSMNAGVALRPLGSKLTFSTAYTQNPVLAGIVTQAIRQDFGLNAKIGCLDFGSGYSITTLSGLPVSPLTPDPQYDGVTLSLGIHFDRSTLLKGNYQDSLLYGGAINVPATIAPRGIRSYGLNLSRSLGPALDLKLDGTVTEDKSQPNPIPGYSAEAKIAARF